MHLGNGEKIKSSAEGQQRAQSGLWEHDRRVPKADIHRLGITLAKVETDLLCNKRSSVTYSDKNRIMRAWKN